MNRPKSASKSPRTFFLPVFILSVPFWLVGPLVEQFLRKEIPIDLPVSALQAVNPLIAALLLIYKKNGSDGVKELMKRSVDYRKVKNKIWYVQIFCLWPLIMVLEYGLMYLAGAPLPDTQFPVLMIPVFFVAFLVAAAGEELGWQVYAIDRLQYRWNALEASIIVGVVWAAWHIVPFMQSHHTPTWIVWQCLGMIPFRILTVWLYNNTGRSVFAAIIFHATANVSQFLFPNNGSHYDPFIACLILTLTAVIVTF